MAENTCTSGLMEFSCGVGGGVVLLAVGRDDADSQMKRTWCRESCQPRLRTRLGPRRLATPMGKRRHKAMKALYLGFRGLFWGTASRLKRRYSYDKGVGSKPQFFLKLNGPVPALLRP